jgi:hypothetical protein
LKPISISRQGAKQGRRAFHRPPPPRIDQGSVELGRPPSLEHFNLRGAQALFERLRRFKAASSAPSMACALRRLLTEGLDRHGH